MRVNNARNSLRACLLLALHAATAKAAEAPRPAEAAPVLTALRGQWTFLNSSTAFCIERVPALKADLQNARAYAEAQMWKAEAIILEEVADNRTLKRHLDTYAENWSKHAIQLAEAMQRQDPAMACPVLLSNWQAADTRLLLEDWNLYLERNVPQQPDAN